MCILRSLVASTQGDLEEQTKTISEVATNITLLRPVLKSIFLTKYECIDVMFLANLALNPDLEQY